ncbi:hypothetical protein ACFE04_018037 [Oxalis oulophora]
MYFSKIKLSKIKRIFVPPPGSLIGITEEHHFARYRVAEDATRKSLRNDFEANFVGRNNILKQSLSHAADIDNFKQALKHASKQKKPIYKNVNKLTYYLTMDATNTISDPELKNSARNILSDPKLLLLLLIRRQYYKANSVSTLDDVAQAAVKVNHHRGKKVSTSSCSQSVTLHANFDVRIDTMSNEELGDLVQRQSDQLTMLRNELAALTLISNYS